MKLRVAAALGAVAMLVSGARTSSVLASAAPDEATIAHVLNRVAFGPAEREMLFIRAFGLERFLDEQLHPGKLPDAGLASRLSGLETLTLSSKELHERYFAEVLELRREIRRASSPSTPTGATPPDEPAMPASNTPPPGTPRAAALANLSPEDRQRVMAARRESQRVLQELSAQKMLRAVYSERQLQEVLVDFWFNHFNVFAGKGPVQAYLTEYEREVIRPHVLGPFRELLGAVAHSPAMLFYLDNWQSSDPNMTGRGLAARAGGRPGRRGRNRVATMSDEERARARAALEQRAPRGLNENYARELLELHTLGVDGGYTQQDIVDVAKAFTGWTIRGPRQGGGFWFDDRRHVKGPKQVLGTRIDRGGEQDGEAVLDLLARHPSTATLIATKLARRFVADDPPPALVARAADTFRRTQGDLREVTRTIITAPELLAPEARHAKVKTPFEFVASALRAANADITDATPLVRHLRELGMPLYFAQPPTGYADRADAWVNTGALLGRMNFALALVDNRIDGVRIDRGPQVAAVTLGSPEFQRR